MLIVSVAGTTQSDKDTILSRPKYLVNFARVFNKASTQNNKFLANTFFADSKNLNFDFFHNIPLFLY
jgi:hypothetical protein